ncbi:hypothetical protein [Amnibacterium sp.]|uniref:hypothetical protein n=1 Tax=Amnibacterium sp. TaxID=1872496 RepID=UPI003F7BD64E
MHLLLMASTPSPAPVTVNENAVTPGVVGFLAILLVTLATVALIVDMTRRIRRVRYRGELAERREQERTPDA